MSGRVAYRAASIEWALEHHRAGGRIESWRRLPEGRYMVGLNRLAVPAEIELRSLREAHVFVAGLASASHAAPPRKT